MAVGAIAVIVVLISWAKLHPFLALIVGSAVVGLGSPTSLPGGYLWRHRTVRAEWMSPSAP